MAIDGLTKVKRIKNNSTKKVKIEKKSIFLDRLKRNIKYCIKIFKHNILFKVGYVSIIIMLIISISTFATYSYNIVNNNIDILQMFQNGRYLLLFQNNTEMRATGGFIGSYAVVEVSNGIIKDYYFDANIYKNDNEFTKDNAIIPTDQTLKDYVGNNWAMRDANWSIDYPEAAKKTAWFYEMEGGEPVDGVIAINATVMSDLLGLIGPIYLPEYEVEFNKDNFIDAAINKVEKDYWTKSSNWVKNEPKSILRDMMPKVLENIVSKNNYGELTSFIKKELNEKQILMYFYDENKERKVLVNNWGGEVKKTQSDYLYINNSNLGGKKSSLLTKEKINLSVNYFDNGNTVNNLIISRTYTSDGKDNLYGPYNKNYMRILVPEGSKIISAKMDEVSFINEIEIKKESGKTVFGFWMSTEPGQTKVLNINYELPENIRKDNYSLYLQKQPGNLGDETKVFIENELKFNGIFNTDLELK